MSGHEHDYHIPPAAIEEGDWTRVCRVCGVRAPERRWVAVFTLYLPWDTGRMADAVAIASLEIAGRAPGVPAVVRGFPDEPERLEVGYWIEVVP